MNIPVTSYFFEKLDIYERCQQGDKLTTERFFWAVEAKLLKASVTNDHYLIVGLTQTGAQRLVRERDLNLENTMKSELMMDKAFQSLIENGFATGNEHLIKFTEKARKWGVVLLDIENKKTLKYTLILTLIRWAAIMFLLGIIISNAYEIGKIFSTVTFGTSFLVIFFIFFIIVFFFWRT